VSSPELSVVCKSCGSEVSPYVTECPYCGTRIRKRAPDLEHGEEGLTAKEPRGKRIRKRREKRKRERAATTIPGIKVSSDRPYATMLLILAPAILLLVTRAIDHPLTEFGAIVQLAGEGPLGQPWWHYLAAPFVYADVGYLFAIGVAVALFGSQLEKRLGSLATIVLAVGCGALGMLGAEAIESVVDGAGVLVIAAGGNGMALGLLTAWTVLRAREARATGEVIDIVPIAIAATVLFALPLVEDSANVFAGLTGAVIGALAGLLASFGSSRRA
jgi:membrane associated rhomboid family serine protease